MRPTGKLRCESTRSISLPTIPVAPTTATFNRLEVGTGSVYFDLAGWGRRPDQDSIRPVAQYENLPGGNGDCGGGGGGAGGCAAANCAARACCSCCTAATNAGCTRRSSISGWG